MDVVTCQYCGARSLLDRGRGRTHVPQNTEGMLVVRVLPSSSSAPAVVALAGVLLAAGIGVAVLLSVTASSKPSRSISPGITPPSTPFSTAPRSYFSDQPMVADVNDDGVPDVIGKSNIPAGDEWIAAYDGRNGKELWRTANLSKDAAGPEARRAVVGDRLISVDSLGKAQAYDLRTGAPLWSAPLGEKAERVCQGDALIVVQTVDEAKHGLEPATGKKRELAKNAACASVPTSHKDEAPGYQIVGWWKFAELGLPQLHDVDGLSAHRALVPNGPGPRFLLGSRAKGSAVAMVAAVDKKKILWKEMVPGVDPLTTKVNVTTQEAGYVNGLLVIPYNMKDNDAGVRMACFDGATGKRLWDVLVHKKTQVAAGLGMSANDVFFASWTALYAISLKTGQQRFMLGTEF